MSSNIFENGRSPEFIQKMIASANKTRELREQIAREEITLDEAAQQLYDFNGGKSHLGELRNFIGRGLEPKVRAIQLKKTGR